MSSHFFHFSVLLGTSFISNKVGHGERGIFAFDYVVKLPATSARDEAALMIMSVSVLV